MSARILRHQIKRIVADAGKSRLATTGLVLAAAMLITVFSWRLPFIGQAERVLYDLRVTVLAPHVEQDTRIVLVAYSDQTLIKARKRSPLDRGMLSRALAAIDTMGARSVGIDILMDQPQDEDPDLRATLRSVKTPVWLAYAERDSNTESIVAEQQAFLDGFMRALKGSNTRPASIRLEEDSDGVVRGWPRTLPGLPPFLPKAMDRDGALDGYHGGIRYRIPRYEGVDVFTVLPIELLADADPATTAQLAGLIRGRHVLVGGTIVDVDRVDTPLTLFTKRDMPGLEVLATMLAQSLDGAALRPIPLAMTLALGLAAVISGSVIALLSLRWYWRALFLIVQVGFFGGLPLLMGKWGWDTIDLPGIGWLIGWAIAFAAVGSLARSIGAEQRRFAQSALGKYLPEDVARLIIDNPEKLALHGERREIFIVFTDLEGFTQASHATSPEIIATQLNRYLDMMSDVVLSHGGTIDKFMGDAVVALWGAPIKRDDDGTNAAKAAYALWKAGEAFRQTLPDDCPPIGRTRVGLHFGEAIIGNFGGRGRIQYTALGDAMNTASRLESANKDLGTSVVASREAIERSGLDWWRPLGALKLRGRQKAVEIFEPAPDFPVAEADLLTEMLADWKRGHPAALARISALVARHTGDKPLQNMLDRLRRETEPVVRQQA